MVCPGPQGSQADQDAKAERREAKLRARKEKQAAAEARVLGVVPAAVV